MSPVSSINRKSPRVVATPDGRKVTVGPKRNGGYSSVSVFTPAPRKKVELSDFLQGLGQDAIDSIFNNRFRGSSPDAALESLVFALKEARAPILGGNRTTADEQELTVYVADERAAEDTTLLMGSLGLIDQAPRQLSDRNREPRLEFREWSVRVAVRPRPETASRALEKDLASQIPPELASVFKGAKVSVAKPGPKLVVELEGLDPRKSDSVRDVLRQMMSSPGGGLTFMGHPVEVKSGRLVVR